MPQTSGHLHVAHGERFVAEAALSAARVKRVDSGAVCALVTDATPAPGVFDEVLVRRRPADPYSKLALLAETPFDRTLFLDTDTWAVESLAGLFRLLDWFDLAMAPAPAEVEVREPAAPYDRIPGLVSCNSGVILYRGTDPVRALFRRADALLRDHEPGQLADYTVRPIDQPFLAQAIAETPDLKVHVLPNVWNLRTHIPTTLHGRVRLLHGRLPDEEHERFAARINATERLRFWNPVTGEIVVPSEQRRRLRGE